jgi:hypothetical protein
MSERGFVSRALQFGVLQSLGQGVRVGPFVTSWLRILESDVLTLDLRHRRDS